MTGTAMAMLLVDSASLAAVGYDHGESTLLLGFHNGSTYQYFDVPPAIWAQLLAADSKGGYFHREIRGRFRCVRAS